MSPKFNDELPNLYATSTLRSDAEACSLQPTGLGFGVAIDLGSIKQCTVMKPDAMRKERRSVRFNGQTVH